VARPVNPNSARQQRLREAQARQRLHGRPKLATDNGRLVIPPGLIDAIQANAKERRKTRADHPELNPFRFDPKQLHPPGSLPPKEVQMAMDQAIGWAAEQWMNGGPLGQVFAEGLAFPGYPYLSELAQRPEYRTAAEITATEMTRKWIDFSGKGTAHQKRKKDREMAEDFGLPDPYPEERDDDEAPETSEKQEKISQLEEYLDNLNCRGAYRLMEATDCYFGRAHLFHEINGNDGRTTEGREELISDIGLGTGDLSSEKVGKRNPLTRLTNVEPLWIYPTTYNAMNPLVRSFYNPDVWYMQGIPVHCSRMLTQIGRPVPDMLKPAYSFGGLSLSQMMQPYVNIWLETRESIGRLIHAFSVMILMTDMQTTMQPGGAQLMERVNLFNTLRDNNGTFVLNKATEDFKNVSVPLSGLHELQAQSQEHLCSVIRVPVAVYTGISPTGLNASSEGEIRIFENAIHAAQESRYRQNLTKTINFAQLSLWDEIDPDITFDFVQLRELTEKEEAELRKLDAETDDLLMNGCQAISPEEVRIRVAGDDNGPHAGIDPDDLPEPPQPPPGAESTEPPGGGGEQGESRRGEGGAPGEPKPGGRINVSGREEYTGVGESEGAHDAEFKESDHPRAPDGKFGSGTSGAKEVHVTARTNENGKPVILGAHPTASAAEAHRDQVHKSDWDKQQREDFDDPEDREEFPGHEGFMKGQNNAHGELANPENIVRWHAGQGGVGEGGETHVVATGEHSEAAGGPTMNIKVHGSYATKREAEAAASVVAAQAWAEHGEKLGHDDDAWNEAIAEEIEYWNETQAGEGEKIDPDTVSSSSEMGHAHPEGYSSERNWYFEDDAGKHYLPPALAKQIDALEEQPAPYPGLKKALAYWRDAGDYEHVAPVIKQLKMAP
jgi:uncharacterized protein